ncbi:restriction endonuclease subunit S [Edwardsiella ictaluri]|uniref:restriction endonuclease subunit S n=1 Tax=Edwardsiella ictaluri TaxID=67780 RepID=UPI0039F66F47
MANYKAYPEYKDSGVEWLGRIPSSWQMWKLSHAYAVIGSGTTPTSNDESYFQGDIPWVTTGELREKIIYDTDKKIKESTLQTFSALKIHPAGSVVIAMYGATIGRLGILGVDATTNQACCVMTNSKIINNQYLYYWLQAYRTDIIRLSSGGGQPNINQEKVSSLKVSAPALNDQTLIVAFLDHETAKIDNLIEKQQQLIELLKEKRQAVISHAVTKGLNPDAPMKDSGVEWLGEVPEHWTISTLKHHAKFIDGDRGSEYPNDNDLVDDGVVFLSSKNISNWEINIDDANYISREKFNRLNRGKAINGDVIVKVRGSTGRIGELAIFETERLNKSTAFINAQMMIIRLKNSFNNRFLCNVAQGHYWMEQLNVGAYGTAQQQLNNAIFSGMIMVVPPIDEQLTINKFLELEIKRFDGLIKNTSNMIQLIQERRTALISAAVTGKIDVRAWVAPETQDTEEPQEVSA